MSDPAEHAPRTAPSSTDPHDGPDAAPHGGWAPPAAPPFGVPAAAHPDGRSSTARFAPPPGYAAPAGYPSPSGYSPAPGYPGAGGPYATSAPPRRSRTLGMIALVLALLAAVGASLFAALASFNVGLGTGRQIAMGALGADFDWSILTPVRDWVLMGEIAFWAGTVMGVWALVQGIVAIATHRGRGPGIAAVVIAAVGPAIFGAVVQGFLTAGFAAGSGIAG
ncbi:hypothetical protein K0817_014680 [Microbacterium sp. HD4P20]|uniref:hypothetical protein n=1 Tax=Microbacterium sp. HD4P20 TaxID=2864874 RepID=UPI001C63F909|nr:hypothetical protein [Microbacterium sp. HD4P20]MCP2637797.1 hypothetical protein [Microbacterium sp. HD4P20]